MRIACLAIVAALGGFAFAPVLAVAQKPAGGGQAAAPARPAPYKQVAVSLPKPLGDPGLDAFRKDLTEITNRKDRSALAAKVVAKGFFWQREDSNGADPKKSGIDNLAAAIGLDAPDGSGWQALAAYAQDATAAAQPEMKNVLCSPASPSFNEAEIEKVAETTKTDPADWSFPTAPGVEVRAKPDSSATIVDKLGMYMVRMLPDESANASADWIKVVTAGGKVGFVPANALAPLGSDQLCYTKEGGSWRIAGYIGSGGGQE
jgi:hypothetical protein